MLFGDSGLDYNSLSGARVSVGAWLSEGGTVGVEAGGFWLQRGTTNFAAQSGRTPLILRPIFNPLIQEENAFATTLPGELAGSTTVTSTSQLWGCEANLVAGAYRGCRLSGDLLLGFRYLDLRENLVIRDNLTSLTGRTLGFLGVPVAAGGAVTDFDSFEAHNHFYGPQLGGRLEWQSGRFSAGLSGKVGLGWTRQTGEINGASTLLAANGAVLTAPGGILAQTSNIGRRSDTVFSVVPEVGLTLGANITSNLRATAGYNFLYWSDVARPGLQIDRVINPRLVPTDQEFGLPGGPLRPAPLSGRTDFWAHGLTFGLEFRY